jgi:serine/threonine-protein kinase RsbW
MTMQPETSGAREHAMTAGSPWRCSRAFPARADQVTEARTFLARLLGECPLSDDAILICSELCTNAIVHSDSHREDGSFILRAEVREGDYVWLEVEDQGGRWAEPARCEESGRGLEIVVALADYWDVRGDDTGRVVCARLDWPGASHVTRV